MTHVRTQVRNKVTELIKTVSELEKSTFESRVYELTKEDLPAALVFTEDELVEVMTKQNQGNQVIQKRMIAVGVYIFARTNDNLENELDRIVSDVEKVIFEDQTLGGIALGTQLGETSLLIGGDPDAPTGAARLLIISTVLTQQGDPDTPLQTGGGIFS